MDQSKYILAIRRENKSVWERRVALTPKEVKSILENHPNITILVQPSSLRIFSDSQYLEAGAIISEDISSAQVIVGVKEIPIQYLLPNKTYLYFAHVIKAQHQNMAALDHILANNIRLIDYEKITSNNQRLVAFGRFAGLAGMVDFLSGFGLFLLQKNCQNPFLPIALSYKYASLDHISQELGKVHSDMVAGGLGKDLDQPWVFGITGSTGRVGQGALEILYQLNYKIINMEQLDSLYSGYDRTSWSSTLYLVFIEQKYMVQRIQDGGFDKNEYYEKPHLYKDIFSEKYLKYMMVIVNCMYWDSKYQRLVSCQQMRDIVEKKESRLLGVCDITCDFQGSFEFCKKFTDPDEPFFTYDPISEKITDGCQGQTDQGILYHAMDFLPCELAYDASSHFGSQLLKFIPNIVFSDTSKPFDEQGLCTEIQNSVITYQGQLTPQFQYITLLRNANQKIEKNQKQIKKQQSFLSFNLRGKLLTSEAFENLSSILQNYEIQYNFQGWRFFEKNTMQEVCLQIFSSQIDNSNFLDNMKQILENFEVQINTKN